MKLKIVGLAVLPVMVLVAFASSASAATLEVGGSPDPDGVTITASPKTSLTWKDTEGFAANTCTTSTMSGETKFNHTSAPTGELTNWTFGSCTRPVNGHAYGALEITSAGGTNGYVYSEGTELTVGSPFGTLTCVTGSTTKIGTLTGTGDTSKHATMDINAVINCGFFIPTAKWEGTYTVTSPTGLGVKE